MENETILVKLYKTRYGITKRHRNCMYKCITNSRVITQAVFACSKSAIETGEQCEKFVQS